MKNLQAMSFTSKDHRNSKRYDRKVRSKKTGKKRYEYLHRILKKQLYVILGYDSFEDYLKASLSEEYEQAQVQRYTNHFKITSALELKISDYTEGLLRPLTPFLQDHRELSNIWDTVCNCAGDQKIKPRHIQEGILTYRKHKLIRSASKNERKTIKKILKLIDSLPADLSKQLKKQLHQSS